MSDPEQPKETRPQRATSKSHADVRAAALEKALRDNLRRRKAAQPETPEPNARRATDSQTPSRSEALGQGENVHEKGKENPEGDA